MNLGLLATLVLCALLFRGAHWNIGWGARIGFLIVFDFKLILCGHCAQDALDRILPTVHKTMRSIIECRPLDICSLCPWTLQLRCTLLIPYMRSALNVIHTLDRSKSHHYNVEKKIYRNIASFDAILRLPLHYTVFIRKRCGNVPL